ncbi:MULTISPECIES: glycine-rich domain-containing protein [Methylobacter]
MITTTLTPGSRGDSDAVFVAAMDALVIGMGTWAGQANALSASMNAVAAGTAIAIPYTFSTTTTDADPGAGVLRLNNATQNLSTVIRTDLTDSAATDWTSVLNTLANSTSVVKGQIRLIKVDDGTRWLVFNVTALASPAGYKNITVTPVGASTASPFANGDGILLQFTATGDLGAAIITRSPRTSNTALGATDLYGFIDVTGGTFTQTFNAAATLGNGWWCRIRNNGTGEITLDPYLSELIDGVTSYIMYPGETRFIVCDGTAFFSIVETSFYRVFTATGTFKVPPGYSLISGLVWGSGCSGQKSGSVTAPSMGGSGGGCFPFTIPAASLAATETVTIGSGGASVTTTANGNIGGSTSFGSWFAVHNLGTWTTGSGVINKSNRALPSTNVNDGYAGSTSDAVFGGSGSQVFQAGYASSLYGASAGGSMTSSAVVFAPGLSSFGGNGGVASSTGNGADGAIPGGGGGATQTGAQSGAGARGEIRIWGII